VPQSTVALMKKLQRKAAEAQHPVNAGWSFECKKA
jgi:hypothetical protein